MLLELLIGAGALVAGAGGGFFVGKKNVDSKVEAAVAAFKAKASSDAAAQKAATKRPYNRKATVAKPAKPTPTTVTSGPLSPNVTTVPSGAVLGGPTAGGGPVKVSDVPPIV